jgi:hypothetical protein
LLQSYKAVDAELRDITNRLQRLSVTEQLSPDMSSLLSSLPHELQRLSVKDVKEQLSPDMSRAHMQQLQRLSAMENPSPDMSSLLSSLPHELQRLSVKEDLSRDLCPDTPSLLSSLPHEPQSVGGEGGWGAGEGKGGEGENHDRWGWLDNVTAVEGVEGLQGWDLWHAYGKLWNDEESSEHEPLRDEQAYMLSNIYSVYMWTWVETHRDT